MPNEERHEHKKEDMKKGSLFVPAGVLLGIGIGLITGQVAGYTLVGLGVGFFLYGIIYMLKK